MDNTAFLGFQIIIVIVFFCIFVLTTKQDKNLAFFDRKNIMQFLHSEIVRCKYTYDQVVSLNSYLFLKTGNHN